MNKVIDKLPNITPNNEVLMFVDYVCIEHYPFAKSEFLGRDFADLCDLAQVSLPEDSTYAYYRRKGYTTVVKEFGRFSYIINSKICFPQNEQNA